MNLLLIMLSLAVILLIWWIPYKSFKLIREGGQAITEAAQQLNNKRLQEAGVKINKGADLLIIFIYISLFLSIWAPIIALAMQTETVNKTIVLNKPE